MREHLPQDEDSCPCYEAGWNRVGGDHAEICAVGRAEQERDDWHRGRQESEDVIRRIVALVPRDAAKEDIFQAVRRVVRAEADLARVRKALDSEYLEPADKLVVIRRALSGAADKTEPRNA